MGRREEVFGSIVRPIREILGGLMGDGGPKAKSQFLKIKEEPNTIESLRIALGLLHGVGRTSGRLSFRLCHDFVASFLTPSVALVDIYAAADAKEGVRKAKVNASESKDTKGGYAEVVSSVIILFRDTVEAGLSYCDRKQASHLLKTSLSLVKCYANRKSVRKLSEIDEQDIVALLALLSGLKTENLDDMSAETRDLGALVVVTGFLVIMELLNPSLLALPAVYNAFFRMLGDCIAAYPRKLVSMDEKMQGKFLECIGFALRHHDPTTIKSGLRALRAMTLAILRCAKDGGKSGVETSIIAKCLAKVSSMQGTIVKMLLVDKLSSSMVDPLSDTLFPLLVAAPHAFADLAKNVVQRAGESNRQRVQRGFELLLNANGLKRELTQENRNLFRGNTRLFLKTVRSVLDRR